MKIKIGVKISRFKNKTTSARPWVDFAARGKTWVGLNASKDHLSHCPNCSADWDMDFRDAVNVILSQLSEMDEHTGRQQDSNLWHSKHQVRMSSIEPGVIMVKSVLLAVYLVFSLHQEQNKHVTKRSLMPLHKNASSIGELEGLVSLVQVLVRGVER